MWCQRLESNQRPTAYRAVALPAELLWRGRGGLSSPWLVPWNVTIGSTEVVVVSGNLTLLATPGRRYQAISAHYGRSDLALVEGVDATLQLGGGQLIEVDRQHAGEQRELGRGHGFFWFVGKRGDPRTQCARGGQSELGPAHGHGAQIQWLSPSKGNYFLTFSCCSSCWSTCIALSESPRMTSSIMVTFCFAYFSRISAYFWSCSLTFMFAFRIWADSG